MASFAEISQKHFLPSPTTRSAKGAFGQFQKNIFPFVHTGVGSTRFGGVSGNSQNILLSHLLGGKKQVAERARKNRRKLSAAVAPVHKKDTEVQYLSLEKACAFLYNF